LAVRYQQITNSALAGGHDVSILDQMLGGLSGGGSPLEGGVGKPAYSGANLMAARKPEVS
jgi:hypothetical protein